MRRNNASPPRNGVVLVYLIIAFALLAAFVSFAVDLGNVRLVKADLAGVVDLAARAACSGLAVSPAEARARAKAIALENLVNSKPLVLLDSDIELGTWNATTRQFTLLTGASEAAADAVRITGQLKTARGTDVKMIFLPIAGGQKTVELTASSVCSRAETSQDIVVVQDVSGSFSGEIDLARTGDRDLLDALYTSGGTSSYGLVAFTGTATTVTPLRNVRSYYTWLKYYVSTLSVGGSGMPSTSSGTDIAAGIEKALSVFNNYVSASPSRSLVIVSDGESSANWQGAHPGLSNSQLLTLAQQDANTAWAQGINVFVVFWDTSNNATAAANLKSLIRGKGTFVHVTDPTKLSESIATVLRTTQLVK